MHKPRINILSLTLFLTFGMSQIVGIAFAQEPAPGVSGAPPAGPNEAVLSEIENKEVNSFESEMSRQPVEVVPTQRQRTDNAPAAPIDSLTDLSKLAPFREVSVLQKRFLPKTQRFQFSGGLTMVTNDPWYWNFGAGLRLGYYFREAWGIEGSGEFFSHSERDQVKDLRQNNSIKTDSIVFVNNYMGVDVIWNPIYGKMSLRNLRIIPYDIYFAAGMGTVGVGNATQASVSAMHLGTGQIFGLTKNTAFRWNFDWKYFTAQPQNPEKPSEPLKAGNFSYFMLSAGISYFFPETRYR